MSLARRRGILLSVAIGGGVVLLVFLFGIVALTANSAARSSAATERTSRDFADYRKVTEDRSERASDEREALTEQVATLAKQNKTLTKQVDELTKLLRRYGIDTPSSVGGSVAAPQSSSQVTKKASGAKGATKPRKPVKTTTPAPTGDPLVCLPVVGCLL